MYKKSIQCGGRKQKDPQDKQSKHVLISPRLWELIQRKTEEAGSDDWRDFLEMVLRHIVTKKRP